MMILLIKPKIHWINQIKPQLFLTQCFYFQKYSNQMEINGTGHAYSHFFSSIYPYGTRIFLAQVSLHTEMMILVNGATVHGEL